jgi:hypothetical protein
MTTKEEGTKLPFLLLTDLKTKYFEGDTEDFEIYISDKMRFYSPSNKTLQVQEKLNSLKEGKK